MPILEQDLAQWLQVSDARLQLLCELAGKRCVTRPLSAYWQQTMGESTSALLDQLLALGLLRPASAAEQLQHQLDKPALQAMLRTAGGTVGGSKAQLAARLQTDYPAVVAPVLSGQPGLLVPTAQLKALQPVLLQQLEARAMAERMALAQSFYQRDVREFRTQADIIAGLVFYPGNQPCAHAQRLCRFYRLDALPSFPPPQCDSAFGCTCFWVPVLHGECPGREPDTTSPELPPVIAPEATPAPANYTAPHTLVLQAPSGEAVIPPGGAFYSLPKHEKNHQRRGWWFRLRALFVRWWV